jgi:hypothetical protein
VRNEAEHIVDMRRRRPVPVSTRAVVALRRSGERPPDWGSERLLLCAVPPSRAPDLPPDV